MRGDEDPPDVGGSEGGVFMAMPAGVNVLSAEVLVFQAGTSYAPAVSTAGSFQDPSSE